jgi:Domain of unknown function (DUF4492)
MTHPFRRIFVFYRDGFRAMRLGRKLWTLILIKLVLLFLLARFFLPDQLKERFASDRERAAYVLDHLTDRETVR